MKSRIILLFIGFVAIFGLLVTRAFYVQVMPNAQLDRLIKNQYLTIVSLPASRGKILDRRGEELATSILGQSLYADPKMITTPKKLSRKLAQLLKLPPTELLEKLTAPKRFVWIKRQLDPDLVEEIKSWKVAGLGFIEEGRRAYPNQHLLSQVLGFVGTEGSGLEGLEKKFDEELKGEKQSVLSRRDARGRPLLVSGQIFELHADGATLETTIDKELQYELEHELEQVTINQQADRAMGVILDPFTGEVLAMGSYPGAEPGYVGKFANETRRNRPVTDVFEPGSTFKVVTVAAALRTGRIQPNSKYFCENGKFKIGKHYIHEAETSHSFGWLTLSEILEVSSNIGSTKVAFDVGEQPFKDMIQAFGFGSKVGNDFLGESAGLVNTAAWNDHLLSNVSFGHGIGVTALQLASAYSTIANGGKLMRPYVVKRIVDSDRNVLEERTPLQIRQVLNPKEASTLAMMLSAVTENGGTGVLARVDGYPVAGKTGTAQKVNPNGRGYLNKQYLSSFAGFVPANNPQFTIYIVVDNPRKQFFGAQVAAPVFHRIASFALHKRGFMPMVMTENLIKAPALENKPEKKIKVVAKTPSDFETVPNLKGLTLREVGELMREYNKNREQPIDVQLIGRGVVDSQNPAAGK